MKKKLSSILGVSLALVLAFTLVGGFMPANTPEAEAATAFTPNQWNAMPTPTPAARILVAGSLVTDFAVASDGTTIYLVNGGGAVPGTALAKSTNGGRTFSWITLPAAFVTMPVMVAVAPDDPETVAVVEGDTTGGQLFPGVAAAGDANVWISKTGGSTWVNLGIPNATGVAVANKVVSDIAVSPARVGTILDRDYAVCTYDDLAMTGILVGDIWVCGTSTTWVSVGVAAGAANYDFTSIALTPNWVGEFGIIAIGSDNVNAMNADAGTGVGDTYMIAINADLAALNPTPNQIKPPLNMDTTSLDSPSERLAATGVGQDGMIETSSISLPADFDSTGVAFFKAYIGWKSTNSTGAIGGNIICGDDAYRVDYNSPRKLQIMAAVAVNSVDYSGLCMDGTLFVGESDKINAQTPVGVWFTDNPMSGVPTWEFSYKSPTSTGALNTNCKVVASPDFQTTNVVYGGCAGGPDTAFSKSEDGGYSFNGISFIDEAIVVINDVMPTPGGEYVFMATEDAAGGNHSLWRCPNVPAVAAWDRVGFQEATTLFTTAGSIVRISPDWTEDSAVYWFDTSPAPAAAGTGTRIRRSTDNGQIWSSRSAIAAVADATVESKDVLYMISSAAATSANVYTSVSGGWSFGLPVNPAAGPLDNIAMAPSYPQKPVAGNVLVGADGTVAAGGVVLSTDGAASFRPLLQFMATGAMKVQADVGYADNNIVYAGSTTAGGGIWRYEIGVSSAWEQIENNAITATFPTTAVMSGLVMQDVLYGSWSGGAVAVGADSFTIWEQGTVTAAGWVTVLSGEVIVTPFGTATVNAGNVAVTVTAPATCALATAAVNDYFTVTASVANSSGTWGAPAGVASLLTAAVTVDTDSDASVGAGPAALNTPYNGAFSLPDIAAAAVASGAARTLGPLDSVADINWQNMTVGSAAATFNTAPTALRACGTATDTWLYTIDTVAPAVMGYNDTMAKAEMTINCPSKVPADPATGKNNSFSITWSQPSNAISYHAFIFSDPVMPYIVYAAGATTAGVPAVYSPLNPGTPAWDVPADILASGRDYWFGLRAVEQSTGDGIRSGWAPRAKFTVEYTAPVEAPYAGPVLLGPAPGTTGVSLTPAFSWGPVSGALNYEFELATNPGTTAGGYFIDALVGKTGDNALVESAWACDITLDYATNYYWQVKAITAAGETGWTIGTFTTMSEAEIPVPPAPPVELPAPITPAWIWAIVAIGGILVIVVIILIFVNKGPR